MRIAYLDCFSGISGDMFLGALVDAGVSPDLLRETVHALNIGAELEFSRVDRNGISATKVDVIVDGVKDMPREEYWEKRGHSHQHKHADGTTHSHPHEHPHEHGHEHGESQSHKPSHEHSHSHDDAHPHEHHHENAGHSHEHRGLKEIRAIIQGAEISATAKQTALAIFQALGEAEAKIHNKDLESIHFHEVGSVDAIVDIVCAAVGAESLDIDTWHCSALNVGSGVVHCAHGTLPIPAPATVELLKNAPVYSSGIKKELVTPTGAAIVKTLVADFGDLPAMTISSVGYGAGARNLPGSANVVRITVGELTTDELSRPHDKVTVIEANLDDMSPQVFGYVLERLMDEGALDAFGTPAQMKKSRPGMLLTVLARTEDAQRLARLIFSETTTIGMRMREEVRYTLAREFVQVETAWGSVRIKVAKLNGRETNSTPEFDDCRKLAIEHDVPLKSVMREAMRVYMERKKH